METVNGYNSNQLDINQEMELKEKITHLNLVIKQLSQQLESEKRKASGAETVTILLQEAQTELANANKQKKALETAVRNLKNRLEVNRLPNDISLGEDDIYIASLCPQTLENLARENVRLKNLLHRCASREEIQNLNKNQDLIDDLYKKITDLTTENENLQKQLDQLDTLDTTKNKTQDTVGNIHQKEIENFQTLLRNFASQCQDIDLKLSKAKDEHRFRKSSGGFPTPGEQENYNNDKEDRSKEVREKKILELEDKLKEVNAMNMRWQEYNKQRETHVKELNFQISDLQSRTAHDDISQTLRSANEKLKKANDERDQALQIIRDLRINQEDQSQEMERLRAENKFLDDQIKRIPVSGHDDQVAALVAQVQICAEDFENERKDRARAQAKLTEVIEQNDRLKKENETVRMQMDRYRRENEQFKSLSQMRMPTPSQHQNQANRFPVESQLTSRGGAEMSRCEYATDGPGSLNLKDYEIVDAFNKESCQSLPAFTKGKVDSGLLSCPKCSRKFACSKEALAHCETCQE